MTAITSGRDEMQSIVHSSVFEMLSVDLDIPEHVLLEKLYEYGTSEFMQFLRNKDISMFKTPMLLGRELRDSSGSILINKNIPIDKYIDSLFDRYINDNDFRTSSFSVLSSDSVLSVYRSKVNIKLLTEIEKLSLSQEKFKQFYSYISSKTSIHYSFKSFVNNLMSSSDGVSVMLKYIKNLSHNEDVFNHTANSTYLCMALSFMYLQKSKAISEKDAFLNKVACSAFLQNAGILTGTVVDDADTALKCRQAAEIAAILCKDPNVYDTILNRHCYTDGECRPVFKNAKNRSNTYMRIMMTTNLFIDIVRKNKYSTDSIEVHKAMYELADAGYADYEVVQLLAELFLPQIKHRLLEYAFKVQKSCQTKPIIWGVAGDMMPIKLICGKKDCTHAGLHKTLIPSDVEIIADIRYDTDMKAGIYYTCEHLTERLQIYYKALEKKIS